jgi:hypothetical protein
LRCAICGKAIVKGYRIDGTIYCEQHWRLMVPHCANCGQPISGDYKVVGMAHLPICLTCSRSYPPCFLCGAPADPARKGTLLDDGRAICGSDRKTAVFDEAKATTLFQQASHEVEETLGAVMSLRVPPRAVHLVDVPEMVTASRGQYQKSMLMSGRVLGLTTLILKSRGGRHWTEPATVNLLRGIPAERLLTVCAHEYAHVWHAENHINYARTTPEMREGFAEWVAYKVSQHSQRERQVAVLDYPNDGLYYQSLCKFRQLEARVGVAGVLKHALTANDI